VTTDAELMTAAVVIVAFLLTFFGAK